MRFDKLMLSKIILKLLKSGFEMHIISTFHYVGEDFLNGGVLIARFLHFHKCCNITNFSDLLSNINIITIKIVENIKHC